MDNAKNIVKIKLSTVSGIDPELNNGKLEAEAGEEFYTTAVGYTSMLTWPADQLPERIGDFISRDDLPTLDEGGMTATAITARVKKHHDANSDS